VSAFLSRVKGSFGSQLRVLINAAAVTKVKERTETVDGFELMFQVNALSQFATIEALAPILIQNSPSSVVNVASALAGDLVLNDLHLTSRRFSFKTVYKQSKQADQHITWEASKRYGVDDGHTTGVYFNAVHPGETYSQMNPNKKYSPDTPFQAASGVVRLAENLQGTWWKMIPGPNHRVSTLRPRMFDDPVLERKLWDSCAAMWYTCTQKHEPRVVSTPVSEVERARQLEQQGYFVIPQVAPDKAEKIARDIEEHLALHGSRYANAMGGAVLGGWYI
jgi:NAD(P)-dependent dehydrogenase (short-subunit alcohol dehydrogenase family)